MLKARIFSIVAIVLIAMLGWFYLAKPEIDARKDGVITQTEKKDLFKLGLDLVGGSQLTYDADISKIKDADVSGVMSSLKETLNRRLNPFGTSEVSVVVEDSSVFAENQKKTKRVIIQIPGESNPEEAKKKIGKTPVMEFKILDKSGKKPVWKNTQLSGANVKTALLGYDQAGDPVTIIKFDDEGGKIFADLTEKHVGDVMGIFLDGKIISDPVIREAIKGGSTMISFGSETREQKLRDATELAKNLKFGALPVPLTSVSSNTISASLGKDILEKGLVAGFWGLITVIFFLIFFYRLSGVVASVALLAYTVLTLSLFKFFGFVFTAAGIAGFIVSIGMAVDANVLIFEMVKDELREGRKISEAIRNGFSRAWLSIRDGNISSILTAIILFYMTTALVQGFALTFGFGVITSMFSAIVLTRTFLLAIMGNKNTDFRKKLLFGNYKKH